MPHASHARTLCILAAIALTAGAARAQERFILVTNTDSQPIAYAFIQANGGRSQLSDETGRVSMGTGKKQTMTVEVRRIGYSPFYGKIDLPDTGVVIPVMLRPLAQQLGSVKVTARTDKSSLELGGFYRRWLAAQKGASSAVFIGPEEIEKRNASQISVLLSGINGIATTRTSGGHTVVASPSGSCAMAIIIDGRQVCPSLGCHNNAGPLSDQNSVLIDEVLDIYSVAGVEVYRRGGNMPSDFHVDGECGAVAFWTGSRKR
jgi:hypothetical protein